MPCACAGDRDHVATGRRAMMRHCAKCSEPQPVYRETRLCRDCYHAALERVRASLSRERFVAKAKPPPKLTGEALLEARARAIARAVEDGPKTRVEIEAAVNFSARTLRRALPRAVERGYVAIKRTGGRDQIVPRDEPVAAAGASPSK